MLIASIFSPSLLCAAAIWDTSANIGYWFYQDPPAVNKLFLDSPRVKSPEKQASRCLKAKTWTLACGFIPPNNFAFEQKEYRALLKNFSMNAKNHSAVLQWQRFNDWAIEQAMAAAYVSEFNSAQHPELDSTIAHPFSQFGNLLIQHTNDAMKDDFFHLLANTSILVFFTRSNCRFCHEEAEVLRLLAEKTHIPVWNASLDSEHLEGFAHYLQAPLTIKPAQYLQVSTVPAIFLYLAPQSGEQPQEHWIRLATGLSSMDVIEARLLRFVREYQGVLVKDRPVGGGMNPIDLK